MNTFPFMGFALPTLKRFYQDQVYSGTSLPHT